MATAKRCPYRLLVNNLNRQLRPFSCQAPVTHIYNPLDYAAAAFLQYCDMYGGQTPGNRPGRILLMGMNPGPWGMAQTGVPFGAVSMVRDWLKIDAAIGKPAHEHPKRPVTGLQCPRDEVSGMRLWTWARDRFATPERFAEKFFVYNYCPLAFMEESGRNRTPDKLRAEEREALYSICDKALARVIDIIQPSRVIGVGTFAEDRAARNQAIVKKRSLPVSRILHPSPASPAANRDWSGTVDRQLEALGVL
ncbi:MAG: uracil-DNA glycosylase family protein [Planctomycetota bacterium]|jgi:single-strand selective monofunctional uracil DNA glycosylase